MIITMIAMGMMQVAIDKIIDVVTMWHWFMPAAGAVDMAGLMAAAFMVRGTAVGIDLAHLDRMPIHMVAMLMLKMTIDEIVYMVVMTNCGMAAAWAMLMRSLGGTGHREFLSTEINVHKD